MAFGLNALIITRELEKYGYSVCQDEENHMLIVNRKYKFCYTNNYYYDIDGNRLGRGRMEFVKMLKNVYG